MNITQKNEIKHRYQPEIDPDIPWVYHLNGTPSTGHTARLNLPLTLTLGDDQTPYLTTTRDLYRELFPEAWGKVKHRFEDDQTEQYLNHQRKQIGLLHQSSDLHALPFGIVTKSEARIRPGVSVTIGQDQNGRPMAATKHEVINGVQLYNHLWFTHTPTPADVETAECIASIERHFAEESYKDATFTCRDCGEQLHWSDIPVRSLAHQWAAFNHKHCGCSI